MADLGWSNVLAGLIGGAGASVLTFVGAFYLQTYASRRSRRARLLALETELRWNRTAVEALLQHNQITGDLTDLCWRHNFVAFAADLPKGVYSDLRALYYMFPASSDYFRLAKDGTATKKHLHWLQDWRNHVFTAQALVEVELHLTWKLSFRAKSLVRRITRLIPRNQQSPTDKDQQQSEDTD